jgi:hypothetical protein
MKHLVLTIHKNYVSYRMGNRCGSHPCSSNDPPQKVVDFLVKLINPSSHEII